MKTILFVMILLFSVSFAQDKIKGEDKNFKKEDYTIKADEMPFPVGGLKAIQEQVIYPDKALSDSIEGRVYVLTFINEEGEVVRTEIIKSAHPVLNEAALNAVNQIKFTPARDKGKNVKVQVSVPIEFRLK